MQSLRWISLTLGFLLLNNGCAMLNSPSKDQPYWTMPADTESSTGMQAFEYFLYYGVYGAGSALAH